MIGRQIMKHYSLWIVGLLCFGHFAKADDPQIQCMPEIVRGKPIVYHCIKLIPKKPAKPSQFIKSNKSRR